MRGGRPERALRPGAHLSARWVSDGLIDLLHSGRARSGAPTTAPSVVPTAAPTEGQVVVGKGEQRVEALNQSGEMIETTFEAAAFVTKVVEGHHRKNAALQKSFNCGFSHLADDLSA